MTKRAAKGATVAEPVTSTAAPTRARRSRKSAAAAAQPRTRTRARYTTRISKRIIQTIRGQLEQGSTLPGAAAVAGVPRRTFFEWIARGTNGSGSPLEQELARVVQLAVDRAQADGATSLWTDGDWRARMAIMERRWPETWGPPERRVQHGGQVGLYAAITPERLRSALTAGEITAADAGTFARVWKVLVAQAGDMIDGEVLEIEAGDEEVEAA